MQTGRKKELPKRSRYYQSVADVSTTPTGAKYRNLPDNILIFICTFDPFDRALPRYTFQYTCDEDPTLKLQDGSLRIFLNATATELSDLDQKLQAFYHYLQKSLLSGVLRGKQPLSSAGVLAASTQCAASSEGVVLGGARGKTSQPLGRF